MSDTASIAIITKSYRGDHECCRLLCESVDRFVPADIRHTLVVPQADVALFAPLANARRDILAEEEVLPRWFRRIPLPPPQWRKRLFLPRRDVYATPFSLPVRGWIAQQIMKIAAAAMSRADILVHIDSDNAFIRPLDPSRLVRNGVARIYRNPQPVGLATHTRWQHAAGRLLGLEDSAFYGGEYIDPFVVWKTSVVRDLIARIEAVSGTDWIKTLARTQHFAEYVLYGVYADRIAGFEASGLSPENFSLCHSRWSDEFAGEAAIREFVEAVEPHHLTCLIQSTIATAAQSRARVFARVTEFAARQDGRA